MTTENPRLQFSLLSLLTGTALIAVVLAAFSRGNYLFGTGMGITYAVVAVSLICLIGRALRQTPLPRLRLVFLVLFSIPVSLAFAFPMYINPDVQIVADRHIFNRDARHELQLVFAEYPAFSELSIYTSFNKTKNIEIYGTVPNKTDLEHVRQHVYERCGIVKHCFVVWRIHVRSDSKKYVARDEGAFVPAEDW